MIRIAAVLFAAIVSDVPALTDERISRAIEAASEMYVAGRDGACPNLRFNMGALIDMLTSYGCRCRTSRPAASSVMRCMLQW
jgi:2-phospho-L-lactate guanylyltransferase (CobY/MobA/RfbA family)